MALRRITSIVLGSTASPSICLTKNLSESCRALIQPSKIVFPSRNFVTMTLHPNRASFSLLSDIGSGSQISGRGFLVNQAINQRFCRQFSSIPTSAAGFNAGIAKPSTALLAGDFSNSNIGCFTAETGLRFKSKKGKYHMPFLGPQPLRALRKHGLAARMSTRGGRMILMKRMLKGRQRWEMTH